MKTCFAPTDVHSRYWIDLFKIVEVWFQPEQNHTIRHGSSEIVFKVCCRVVGEVPGEHTVIQNPDTVWKLFTHLDITIPPEVRKQFNLDKAPFTE